MQIIEKLRKLIIDSANLPEESFGIEHPVDLAKGDYSTNIAMVSAKKLGKNPVDLANEIVQKINSQKPDFLEKVEVAGPGFINFFLSNKFFSNALAETLNAGELYGKNNSLSGKEFLYEYTDPNPFKQFHIGHLMQNTIGESLSRIAEWNGAKVFRVCYSGDIGLHVAKAIWAMQKMRGAFPQDGDVLTDKTKFLGDAYVFGANEYEDNPDAKKEIDDLNQRIFEKTWNEDERVCYEKGRKWSIEHFEEIFKTLDTKFDKYFFESEMIERGKEIVLGGLEKGVFEKSEGAIIFPGEKYGLHNRVFITSRGLAPYEAKELALAEVKQKVFPSTFRNITVTANEQDGYFKVVLKALEQINPEIAQKTSHISHGMLRLAKDSSGKMSSRKGNIITGESLLNDTREMVFEKIKDRELSPEEKKEIAEKVSVAGIRFTVLKQTTGKDIIFDKDKAISFDGDSGPYLEYSYTRAHSLLKKAESENIDAKIIEGEEISNLEKILYRFPEVVANSQKETAPQHITQYLIDLAGSFNSYYAKNIIVDKNIPEASHRVAIVKAFANTMKNGLHLIGIKAPEKM